MVKLFSVYVKIYIYYSTFLKQMFLFYVPIYDTELFYQRVSEKTQ